VIEKLPSVYIIANPYRGTIYTGVTSALWDRISTHKAGVVDGFSKEHNVKILVWYEHHHSMENAIIREKRIKEWQREWEFRLIEEANPDWRDLHDEIDPIGTLVDLKT
jgi:putative endonuclease